MVWRGQPEPARRRRAAPAELRARQEGARASARSSAEPPARRRAYRLPVVENATSAVPTDPPPRDAQPTRARGYHQRRDCLARRVRAPGTARCRARSRALLAPSRAQLRARPAGTRPSQRPAPKPRQRRLPQRAAIGPAGRQGPAQTALSDVRLKVPRGLARRFAWWDRRRPPTRHPAPVHPRPRTLPIGLSFAGCTGPLKKGTPAAWVPATCALVRPDMGTA